MYFIFYAIFGWFYEVFLEVVVYGWGFSNRGVLFGPFLPVYGIGALTFVFAFYKLIKGKDLKVKLLMCPVIFFGCAFIATVIELATSYILENAMGYWPWQTYLDYAINFEGRIALSPSIRFGVGGILFLYFLQPVFENICERMNPKVFNYLFYCLLIAFTVDLVCALVI